jgi:hypothetical protein
MKRTISIISSLIFNIALMLIVGVAMGATTPEVPLIVGGTLTAVGVVFPEILPTNILAYTFVSVPKDGANPGRPVGKNDQLIVFRWRDVDVDAMPARDTNGVRITGNLVFLAGRSAVELYITPSTINAFNQSTGDPDKKGFIQNFEGEIPGDGLALNEFLENNVNENLGAILRYCDGRTPRLFGTPCVPLQFEVEGTGNNEMTINKLTMKSILPGPVIAHYSGAIPAIDTDSGSGSGA